MHNDYMLMAHDHRVLETWIIRRRSWDNGWHQLIHPHFSRALHKRQSRRSYVMKHIIIMFRSVKNTANTEKVLCSVIEACVYNKVSGARIYLETCHVESSIPLSRRVRISWCERFKDWKKRSQRTSYPDRFLCTKNVCICMGTHTKDWAVYHVHTALAYAYWCKNSICVDQGRTTYPAQTHRPNGCRFSPRRRLLTICSKAC